MKQIKRTPTRKDLLPWKVKTGRRSSRKRKAVLVYQQPSNPPIPTAPETSLVVSNPIRSQEVVQLPLNLFICLACWKSFASSRSLGGHKGHHTRMKNRRRARMEGVGAAGAVNALPMPRRQRRPWSGGACPCLRCGREFSTPQGLGMHRRHCKGPPPLAETNTKPVRCFDLNKPPPPEEDVEVLALPWYN